MSDDSLATGVPCASPSKFREELFLLCAKTHADDPVRPWLLPAAPDCPQATPWSRSKLLCTLLPALPCGRPRSYALSVTVDRPLNAIGWKGVLRKATTSSYLTTSVQENSQVPPQEAIKLGKWSHGLRHRMKSTALRQLVGSRFGSGGTSRQSLASPDRM